MIRRPPRPTRPYPPFPYPTLFRAPKHAATDSGDDAAAVKRAHAYMNEHYLHPALLGRYPPELKEIFGDAWPEFPPQDFDLIVQPLDFVGINYYTRSGDRSEEHTSELQSLMRISYAVFCLKKK